MKIVPVLTEKSFSQAKTGLYSFWVNRGMTKQEIKRTIESLFKVHVRKVQTITFGSRVKKNARGRVITIKARKKAIVRLGEKEKIDFFETKEGK